MKIDKLKEHIKYTLRMEQKDAAALMGYSEEHLCNVLNGKAAISKRFIKSFRNLNRIKQQ